MRKEHFVFGSKGNKIKNTIGKIIWMELFKISKNTLKIGLCTNTWTTTVVRENGARDQNANIVDTLTICTMKPTIREMDTVEEKNAKCVIMKVNLLEIITICP